MHTLASAFLNDGKFDLARKEAENASRGRKRLLGRRHESYFETLSLLVTICTVQNDHETAEVYRHLLPSTYQKSSVSEA